MSEPKKRLFLGVLATVLANSKLSLSVQNFYTSQSLGSIDPIDPQPALNDVPEYSCTLYVLCSKSAYDPAKNIEEFFLQF